MDVAFLLEVPFSFGERQQALSLAGQIARAGYRPRFVVAERVAEHVRWGGFEPAVFDAPATAAAILRAIDPALVIGCELFNLSPALVDVLIASRRPLATTDGTTLGADLHGDPFGVPAFRRAIRLPERYCTLRPCPVSDVGADADEVLHWRAFPDAARAAKDPARYAALGLDPTRATVLLPIAVWASYFTRLAGAPFERLAGHPERLVARVANGLAAADREVDLVVVSDAAGPPQRDRRVAIRRPGLLGYGDYDHLLRSCDALVCDNIVQASLSRAIAMGTPHLLIHALRARELPWPTNIFPIRHRFPAERAFAGAVDAAELEDPDDVARRLAAVLARGWADAEARARRREYLARVAALPDAGAVIARLIGPP